MNLKAVNVSIVVQIKNEIATMPKLIQTQNYIWLFHWLEKLSKETKSSPKILNTNKKLYK